MTTTTALPQAGASSDTRPFANPNRLIRSWYVVARAKHLKTDRPQTVDVLNRRITLWRPRGKPAVAFDARCPHLGADLGQGDVVDGQLRCAFHHWRFDQTGQCTDAPGEADLPDRCTRRYPTHEAHGLIWIYNGPAPAFPPPAPPPDAPRFRRWVLPPQTLDCHPHLVVGNGLDARHFGALHGMQLSETPRLEAIDDHTLTLHLCGRPAGALMPRLLGLGGRDIDASFTTVGGHIAWGRVNTPVPLHVLFTARPGPHNTAQTQTVFYLPRGWGVREARAATLMLSLLHRDRQILERLDFHRGLTDADAPFRRFVDLVDRMEADA